MKTVLAALLCIMGTCFGTFQGTLADGYLLKDELYLILNDNSVWKICLVDEREQTWGEWFLGTKVPKVTPGTTFQPQNWIFTTPVALDHANLSELRSLNASAYPYLLTNLESGEYAFAQRVVMNHFLKIFKQIAWDKGYDQGRNDGYNAGYASGKNHGYRQGTERAERRVVYQPPTTGPYLIEAFDRKITLNNGVEFEVETFDRQKLEHWMPNQRVKVEDSKDYLYPVLITNLDANSKVKARRK